MELLQSNNNYSAAQLTELQAANTSLEKQLQDSEESLAVLQVEHASVILNVETLESTTADTARKLENVEDQIESLQAEKERSDIRCAGLESTKNIVQSQLTAALEGAEILRNEKAAMSSRVQEHEARISKTENLLVDAETKNEEFGVELTESREEVKVLRMDKRALPTCELRLWSFSEG
jgi:chromosome segregation ATPase